MKTDSTKVCQTDRLGAPVKRLIHLSERATGGADCQVAVHPGCDWRRGGPASGEREVRARNTVRKRLPADPGGGEEIAVLKIVERQLQVGGEGSWEGGGGGPCSGQSRGDPIPEGQQMPRSADDQLPFRDRRGCEADLVHGVRREQLVLRTGPDDEDVAILARQIDAAIGRDGRGGVGASTLGDPGLVSALASDGL